MSSRPTSRNILACAGAGPFLRTPSTRTTGWRRVDLVDSDLSGGIQSDSLEALLSEFDQRIRQVPDDQERHVSRPPEADLARTPVAAGLWRAVVTIASTPKAAAVRTMAPTLCGSVIWSSASTTFSPLERVEFGRGEGISLEVEPLVDGIGLDEAVDLVRTDDLGLDRKALDHFAQAPGRVLGRQKFVERALSIAQGLETGCQP